MVSTVSSEDDNTRTDEYWMGVRDALRMVDSFYKWSKRNPDRAKDLEDFIHDGLIAAAKRCESCLRDKMGLSFIEDEEEELTIEDSTESVIDPEESDPEPSFEEPTNQDETDAVTSPPEVSDESSISLDSVERLEDESMDDFSIEGPPHEFSTDFELVEPSPLVVDEESEPESIDTIEPEVESEEALSEPVIEESKPESEELLDKPSFSWSEYETAVTPSAEPEQLDSEDDMTPSDEEEISTIAEDEELPEEPPEPPKILSSVDDPSLQDVDIESDDEDDDEEKDEEEIKDEVDESEPQEEGEDEPVITEPPSPPPPPESEEDEEERQRRARRLFFGA